jgi:hypothetical protein
MLCAIHQEFDQRNEYSYCRRKRVEPLWGEALIPFDYFRLLRARFIDVRLVVHNMTAAELTSYFPDDVDRIHSSMIAISNESYRALAIGCHDDWRKQRLGSQVICERKSYRNAWFDGL